MNITKKQWTIIGVVVALIAIWYFFLRKKPTESSYRTFGASPAFTRGGGMQAKLQPGKGEKICNCAYLGKPEKICSKSVFCNDCCEGSGTSGHRDTEQNKRTAKD